MASRLRKETGKLGGYNPKERDSDIQDLGLLDEAESDAFVHTNLTLEFGDKSDEAGLQDGYTPDGSVAFEGDLMGTSLVGFEVVSAEKIKEGRSSFVKYTILVSGRNRIQRVPGTVEKRYSDFEKLNSRLRKHFPDLMDEVSFPGKLLLGNFKNETIARRSRAFEQYLTHLFSIHRVRFSEEFTDFFYGELIREAHSLITSGEYYGAIGAFEKCLPVQEKLQGDWHPDVISTLCCLVVCYQAIEKIDIAIKYADSALQCLQDNKDDVHYLPLIQQDIYMHWMMGKDKTHLEAKLSELRKQGVKTEGESSLKSLILMKIN